jgi:hypothetical protein
MQLLAQLRRAGWFELTRPYPDRGPPNEVAWYNGLVRIGMGGAGAVVAANAEGLRLVVGSGLSALFVPWSEVTVPGRRGWVDTIIQLHTKAVPALPLVPHLDDAEVDALLRPAGVALPARRWRWGPWLCVAAAIRVLVALLGAAFLWAKR